MTTLRIDLHIHTLQTNLDPQGYSFSMEILANYVAKANLDAIAITNHNCFDISNFRDIADTLGIPVFPGVELNISKPGSYGHVLVIAPSDMLEQFNDEVSILAKDLQTKKDHISWNLVMETMKGIKNYLVIPHYKKKKQMDDQTIAFIRQTSGVDALEVSNNKKWLAESKNTTEPLVCFSDSRPGLRMKDDDENIDPDTKRYAYGFTYVKCEHPTVQEIKQAFIVKDNVSVIRPEADFEILPESLPVSRKLNVLLGRRSTGKSYTLKRIHDSYDDECIYVEQFSITERAKETNFDKDVKKEDSSFEGSYLDPAQALINEYCESNIESIEKQCQKYCKELIVYANSPEDDYSKCPIYKTQPFSFDSRNKQQEEDVELRKAALRFANNNSRKDIISQYFDAKAFFSLEVALREAMLESFSETYHEKKANQVADDIKGELQKHAARKALPNVDPVKELYKEYYREHRLARVIDALTSTCKLANEPVGGRFLKTRTRCGCQNATEARKRVKCIPENTDLKKLFKATGTERLRIIKNYDETLRANALRLIVKVETKIINNDSAGTALSGGQRAEYVFLNMLSKAKEKDIALIDEPESSFDNLFLSTDIVNQLKTLSENTTVFISTHNNALGVSLEPDYLIYTEKTGEPEYHLYSGALSSTNLATTDGHKVSRKDILLDTMEAGKNAYDKRKVHYGIV